MRFCGKWLLSDVLFATSHMTAPLISLNSAKNRVLFSTGREVDENTRCDPLRPGLNQKSRAVFETLHQARLNSPRQYGLDFCRVFSVNIGDAEDILAGTIPSVNAECPTFTDDKESPDRKPGDYCPEVL